MGGSAGSALRVVDPKTQKEVTVRVADQIRVKIRGLQKAIDDSYMQLGELLDQVLRNKLFAEWVSPKTNLPYESFNEYVLTDLGFKERKGMYLISIWRKVKGDLGLSAAEIEGVGWSHMKEIARVADTKEEAQDWIEKAKNQTVADLANDVRTKKAEKKGTPTEERMKTAKVTMFEPQYETYTRAMDLAKEVAKSDKPNHLLEMICLDFCASRAGMDEGMTIEFFTGAIERTFGVKVLVFKDEEMAKKVLRYIANEREPEAKAHAEHEAAKATQKGPKKKGKK